MEGRTIKDSTELNVIISAGIIPAIKNLAYKAETEEITVDSACTGMRLLLDAYDRYYQTGRTT